MHSIFTFTCFHSILLKKSEHLTPLLKIPQWPKIPYPYRVDKILSSLILYDPPLDHSASATPAFSLSLRQSRHTLPAQEFCTCYLCMEHFSCKYPVVCSICFSTASPTYHFLSKAFPATLSNIAILFLILDNLYPLSLFCFFYLGLTTF